jgi:uncharacterized membrane protein YtjA (UPF0391 family)
MDGRTDREDAAAGFNTNGQDANDLERAITVPDYSDFHPAHVDSSRLAVASLACDQSVAITRGRVTGFREQNFPHRHYSFSTVNAEALFMFVWALTFLVIALIAGVLGFGGVAIISIEMAKVIFTVAIILFLVSVIIGFVRGRSAPMP